MARDQKIKTKGSQAQNARSKRRVAPATQIPDAAQTTADTTSIVPDETQVTENIVTKKVSNTTSSVQQGQSAIQQGVTSSRQVVWPGGVQPNWPSWPTSKPGLRSTPPAPGTRPINRFRSEQFEEVGYNQQAGVPATQSSLRSLPDERTTGQTSFDQPTAQPMVGKGKQRL